MSLLSSKLIFVDSDFNVNGQGDQFDIDLPPTAIQAGDRQFIRLILQEFHGYKNFYNVNNNNNTLRLSTDGGSNFNDVVITPGNYETYNEIVDNLADRLVEALTAAGLTYTKGAILPAANKIPTSTTNRILGITLTKASGTTASSFILQAREIIGTNATNSFSDAYALLGCAKVTSASDTTTQSFNVTIDGSGNITIIGSYPMQRSTAEHVYLRSSLINNNLGSQSHHVGGGHGQDLSGTNIFAKIPIQSEFISYSSDSGTGYFVDIPVRNLGQMSFSVTDHKGRRFPQVSDGQAESGNMNYSFVIRVDIIQYAPTPQPNELLAPKPPPPEQYLTPYLQEGAPPRRRKPF